MLSGIGTDKRPGPTDNLSADQWVTSIESRVGDAATRLGVAPKMIYLLDDKGRSRAAGSVESSASRSPTSSPTRRPARSNFATSRT